MSNRTYNVAVVGALGAVGAEMIRTLEQRAFPIGELRPMGRASHVGQPVWYRGAAIPLQDASATAFEGIDIALFSAGADASLQFAPRAVRQGAVVIDNSSAWRMNPDCPLVVPEVNADALRGHQGIVANPNCSTIQLVVALQPIHRHARIRRVVVSTYQAAAGAGKRGLEELTLQAAAIARGEACPAPDVFSHQLAFNLIPQIDVFAEDGYTREEWKLMRETVKIMGDPGIRVTATTVRVPVLVGHSESVNIETEGTLTPSEARRLLAAAPGVCLVDDPAAGRYPLPLDVAGTDAVFVGRIREDLSCERGLNLWIVADNLRKGAALNAVQIAERLVSDGLVRPS